MNTIRTITAFAIIALGLSACGESGGPRSNTATSGRLLVYVEEGYGPLVRALADSFKLRAPDVAIEIRETTARAAVRDMLDARIADTAAYDTSAAIAIIIARPLLDDERRVITERRYERTLLELPIAKEALAVVVPRDAPLQETTVEKLRQALLAEERTGAMLGDGGGTTPLRFIFPSANSGAYAYVRDELLGDGKDPAQPVRWVDRSDSIALLVGAGEGIGLIGWSVALRDSGLIRALKVGSVDSLGAVTAPTRIHITSLVMGLYPLKIPVIGYTLAEANSPANGFLSWVAQAGDAQQWLVGQGLEPENVRFRFEAEGGESRE